MRTVDQAREDRDRSNEIENNKFDRDWPEVIGTFQQIEVPDVTDDVEKGKKDSDGTL